MKWNNTKPFDNLTVGPTVKDIDNLVKHGNQDNANMFKNPETAHKYTADYATKQYALLKILTGEQAESHINGYIHVHDLEYLYARPINCMQHDMRFTIRNGLRVDGTGLHTSVAGPAKTLPVLVNQIGQAMASGQTNMSGGQGLPLMNTFFAPFVVGMSYKEIKQNMQSFIYNLNQAYVSRGAQAIFSSINMDFNIPKWLQEEIAYGPGGLDVGLYCDYQEEANKILLAFTEVMYDGDYYGKPFLFPNTVYRVEGTPSDELLDKVCELSSKFSIPYFTKAIDGEEYHTIMGCRSRLNSNWTGDPNKDCLRTGNLAYVSLNLPRYALKGNFYEELDKALAIATQILLLRKARSEKLLYKTNMMPFLNQEDCDGNKYFNLDNSTLSFGVVGLSDCIRILSGTGLDNPDNQKLGIEIMEYINSFAQHLIKSSGYRWTVLGSPAESTAHRFAMEDRRKYRDRAPVHGTTGSYYYTNSTHVPVDADVDIIEKIKREQNFHKLTGGGHIFHGFIGDAWTNPDVIKNLTKKLISKSNFGFWTTTTAYSFCKPESKLLSGIHYDCPDCKGETEIYDRITGYLQKVSGWNRGKKAEFADRKRY
jgi:ribonucleoside-triphosphate reductase